MLSRKNLALVLCLGLVLGRTSAQQSTTNVELLRETWIDPVRGDDLRGDGSKSRPFRTVTKATWAHVPFNQTLFVPTHVDLDSDGDLDLLLHRTEVDTRVFENVGTPSNPRYEHRETLATRLDDFRIFRSADLDGDGDLDLIYRCSDTSCPDLRWRENLGTWQARFGPSRVILQPDGNTATSTGITLLYGVGDLDWDGLYDVVEFDSEFAAGGCSGNRFLRAWVRWNNGPGAPSRLQLRVPFRTLSGEVVFAACDKGSCLTADLDGDGRNDLIYSTDTELYWCRNVGWRLFEDPVRIAAPDHSNAIDLLHIEERGPNGERWLILGSGKLPMVSGESLAREYFARRIEVVLGAPIQVVLGEPVPYTMEGWIVPPPFHPVFHLAPGSYSAAQGETFPWNFFYGARVVGAAGVEVDSGPEIAMVGQGLEESVAHLRQTHGSAFSYPVWGSSHLEVQRLRIRTRGDAIAMLRYGDLTLRDVEIEGALAGVLLGRRRLSWTDPVNRVDIAHCSFTNCTTAIEMPNRSLYRQVDLRDVHFERNGKALQLSDRGHWTATNCRFLDNQRAVQAFAWRTCTGGPCTPGQWLDLDLLGCHFEGNQEHLLLVSQPPASSNLRVNLWHDTIVGGGVGIWSSQPGVESGAIRVRNSILFPGGPMTSGNFALLDIGFCSVSDPARQGVNGNLGLPPDFALSARDGHLVVNTALRNHGIAPPAAALGDFDGDRRGQDGGFDLGADEVRVPALLGEPVVARGSASSLGVLASGPGAALLFLAAEAPLATTLFGALLQVDPASRATAALPVALDARGVGRVPFTAPSLALYPATELFAQALLLELGASHPRLTPLRRIRFR